MCPTCVFKPDCGLRVERLSELRGVVLSGTNQLCHHDNDKTICRGGRNFQLEVWHRMGMITAPTQRALNEAMRARGVKAHNWRED